MYSLNEYDNNFMASFILFMYNSNIKKIINKIEKYSGNTIESSVINELEDKCTICMDVFKHGECLLLSKCKHLFHKSCIMEMLEKTDTDEFLNCAKCRFKNFLI